MCHPDAKRCTRAPWCAFGTHAQILIPLSSAKSRSTLHLPLLVFIALFTSGVSHAAPFVSSFIFLYFGLST